MTTATTTTTPASGAYVISSAIPSVISSSEIGITTTTLSIASGSSITSETSTTVAAPASIVTRSETDAVPPTEACAAFGDAVMTEDADGPGAGSEVWRNTGPFVAAMTPGLSSEMRKPQTALDFNIGSPMFDGILLKFQVIEPNPSVSAGKFRETMNALEISQLRAYEKYMGSSDDRYQYAFDGERWFRMTLIHKRPKTKSISEIRFTGHNVAQTTEGDTESKVDDEYTRDERKHSAKPKKKRSKVHSDTETEEEQEYGDDGSSGAAAASSASATCRGSTASSSSSTRAVRGVDDHAKSKTQGGESEEKKKKKKKKQVTAKGSDHVGDPTETATESTSERPRVEISASTSRIISDLCRSVLGPYFAQSLELNVKVIVSVLLSAKQYEKYAEAGFLEAFGYPFSVNEQFMHAPKVDRTGPWNIYFFNQQKFDEVADSHAGNTVAKVFADLCWESQNLQLATQYAEKYGINVSVVEDSTV